MLEKSLKEILTPHSLFLAFDEISSRSIGIDEISYLQFNANLEQNLNELLENIFSNSFTPEPLKKIEISKNHSQEKRPIALAAIKDKVIQKALYSELVEYFDKTFVSNSYAYRPKKSPISAINRTLDFIQKENFLLKTDIKDFFESINQEKLIQILKKHIKDEKIINLICLFLHTGSFQKHDFLEHSIGIHQGDILSPMLSNIYLDLMDKFLLKNNLNFIRYADDFVVFFGSKEAAILFKPKLENFLKLLDLTLNQEKTKILHINEGFTFLGVQFLGKNRFLDNEKFQKTISKMHKISKSNTKIMTFIEEFNEFLQILKNYYLKIIQANSTQHQMLKEHVLQAISHKIYLCKENKSISTKKEFKILLEKINLQILFPNEQLKDKIELIISQAYEKYLANKTYEPNLAKIQKKKNEYAQKFAQIATLHINIQGSFIGISKNKIITKHKGKVVNQAPFSQISRIILEAKGISISTDLIYKCAKANIHIDLIDRDLNPYAQLVTYNSSTTQIVKKQAMIQQSKTQIYLASQFLKSKSKNQINYIKYLDKYHENLTPNIQKMEQIAQNFKSATTIDELLGFEGSISAIYWQSIRAILSVSFEKRITQGAKDIVNSSLNYAYAILYGVVQNALLKAGLCLNISFLHAVNGNKPTLSFDLIEEFRTFVVDRTIISMLNKDEPIALNKDGMLDLNSRKLISKNIKEKLGSYIMHKKQSTKIEHLITAQAYKLAHFINDESKTYKPFIGKF